jgi:hypothetical protein
VFTTFANAGNGASTGDVGIELDATTAAYIQNLLANADSNCDFGAMTDFFDPISIKSESFSKFA